METASASALFVPVAGLGRLGPELWGLGLKTAVPTEQLRLLRPREVLAAGVILGLFCHPQLLFLLGVWREGPLSSISGPSPSSSSSSASFPLCPRGGRRDHTGFYW